MQIQCRTEKAARFDVRLIPIQGNKKGAKSGTYSIAKKGALVASSVFLPAKRRGDPVGPVLVVVEPMRFLARVAFGGWVLFVAADASEVPVALPA